MLPGAMLVIVMIPSGVTIVWLTAVTAMPLIVIPPKPSGVAKTMLPVVISESVAEAVPAGSAPRAGRPASLTDDVADTAPAGWSGVMMIVVGSRSIRPGMISSSRGSGKPSSV